MSPVSSNTLLDYSLSTLPDPIQVSPDGADRVHAAFGFVISNPKGSSRPVNVSSLKFSLPIGTGAQQLTNDAGAIRYSISSADWDIQAAVVGGNYVFTVLPNSASAISITTEGLIFQFFNTPVNETVGTVHLTVTEKAAASAEENINRSATFAVAKFPYGFFFGHFTPGVPAVQSGQSVMLTWQGSTEASYVIFWGNATCNKLSEDVTETRTWISPALRSDTTFLLRATVVSGGEQVAHDLTTTVTVGKPEIEATSLIVNGPSSLRGATTVGTLTANGELRLNGQSVSMLGAWATMGPNVCTLATTDGFVCASANDTNLITGRTSATAQDFTISWQEMPDIMHHPLTQEIKPRPSKIIVKAPSFMMPVRWGDYWGVYTDDQEHGKKQNFPATVYWIPFGKPT